MTTLRLVPRKSGKDRTTHEIVEVWDENDYPSALMHIDTLWEAGSENTLYNKLYKQGETVIVELVDISEIEDE